jgi:uncharacterized protein (DUF4415 family)
MSKASGCPIVEIPTVDEDRAITAAAKADPDAQPLKPSQLQAMIRMQAVRGRPKLANVKLLVSVRYGPEAIECFESTGPGWQA